MPDDLEMFHLERNEILPAAFEPAGRSQPFKGEFSGWTHVAGVNIQPTTNFKNSSLREACRQSHMGHAQFWQLEDICWQVLTKQEVITQLLQV